MTIEDTREEIEELLDNCDEATTAVWTTAAGVVQPDVTLIPMPGEDGDAMGQTGQNIERNLTAYVSASDMTEASRPQVNDTITLNGSVYKILRASSAVRYGYVKVFCERISRVKAVHENQVTKM